MYCLSYSEAVRVLAGAARMAPKGWCACAIRIAHRGIHQAPLEGTRASCDRMYEACHVSAGVHHVEWHAAERISWNCLVAQIGRIYMQDACVGRCLMLPGMIHMTCVALTWHVCYLACHSHSHKHDLSRNCYYTNICIS